VESLRAGRSTGDRTTLTTVWSRLTDDEENDGSTPSGARHARRPKAVIVTEMKRAGEAGVVSY
jgi:hypothetical protein